MTTSELFELARLRQSLDELAGTAARFQREREAAGKYIAELQQRLDESGAVAATWRGADAEREQVVSYLRGIGLGHVAREIEGGAHWGEQ